MSAPVTKPAFADKLPPREPSLRELALDALNASRLFRDLSASHSDAEWERRDDATFETRDAFKAALIAATGIEADLWDQVGGLL